MLDAVLFYCNVEDALINVRLGRGLLRLPGLGGDAFPHHVLLLCHFEYHGNENCLRMSFKHLKV